MVLEKYRNDAAPFFAPVAGFLGRVGITPNVVSVTSLAFAVVGGALYYGSGTARPAWLLGAAAFIALNALFDALDGILARLQGSSSKRGDYLDHVIDRYADTVILAGIALSPFADLRLGLLAIVGTFLTSYMGTQAQALGLGRNYGGLLGRADRLVLLIAAPVVEWVLVATGVAIPWFVTATNVLLVWFGVVGNLTAIQRFAKGWRELSSGPDA